MSNSKLYISTATSAYNFGNLLASSLGWDSPGPFSGEPWYVMDMFKEKSFYTHKAPNLKDSHTSVVSSADEITSYFPPNLFPTVEPVIIPFPSKLIILTFGWFVTYGTITFAPFAYDSTVRCYIEVLDGGWVEFGTFTGTAATGTLIIESAGEPSLTSRARARYENSAGIGEWSDWVEYVI